jgi:glyoxylase-like metal-dependent hydrolase (beta-lactamase superfamily II)
MSNKSFAAVLMLALVPALLWSAGGPDAKTIVANATKALGADNLKSIEFSGSGYDFAIGQAPNPSSPWPRFNDKTYTRVINFDAPASRMQRIRTQAENPPRGGGQQPIIGEQQQNQVIAAGSPQAATLWDDLMMSVPYGFLKAAAAAKDTTVSSKSMGGKKYTVVTFTALNKAPAMGYLNSDNMLEKVETKIDNTVLGDIVFETAFTDYKDFAGLKFPTHIVQKQGGYPVLDLTIADVKPNAPANIQAPAAPPAAPAPAAAPTEKLSDGVYLILGGYAALALDYGDHIVVVEGPQSDQRADAVIAAAKQLIPGKPIKYVVNTHAHFDHAGGLRDFVAEGATVITHQMNKSYYEKVWANPHALVPDRLSKNPRKATFKTVTEQLELTGNGHTLMLYHMQNFGHNDGMLMAYLPKEKILLEADAFNPPAQPITQTPAAISPYNQALVANIDRLKLDVQRIIPVHYAADNRVTTTAELMKAVGK